VVFRGSISALLLLAVAVVYAQVRDHEFVNFDDRVEIVHNRAVASALGTEGIIGAFTDGTPYNWIPVTSLSLQLTRRLSGPEPRAFLLGNLFLHAASCVLLFLALERLSGAPGRSAFVAFVFAVHPLHVESVAWASQRKDVLAGFFWMATLFAWARYAEAPERPGRYAAVVVALGLGLLSKPTLVSLPFVLLLLDGWPLGRLRDRASIEAAVREKLPLLAMALAVGYITYLVQQGAGQMEHRDALPITLRLGNGVVAVCDYLIDAFWPTQLAAYYPHPLDALAWPKVVLGGAALAAISGIAIQLRTRCPYLLVGWAWFLGVLAPMIGIIQVSLQARADRYMYLPVVGLSIVVAWGAVDLFGGSRRRRAALACIGGIATAALAVGAHHQVGFWRNSESLFERALNATTDNYFAHNGIATVHFEGRRFDVAEAHYGEAIRLEPRWPVPHLGLARTFEATGRLEAALGAYAGLLRVYPQSADAHVGAGGLLARAGRFEEALEHYDAALDLGRDTAEVRAAAGTCAARLGRVDMALVHLDAALAHRPGWIAVELERRNLLRTRLRAP